MALVYIDGTTLSNSTAVYTDATLSTCASAGFYSDGSIVREQIFVGSNCQLLAVQSCPSCATPCGSTINAGGGEGIYRLSIDLGGTSTDTGAVVVRFDPQSVPDGIKVTYDSTVYNKLSSPQFGLLQANNAGTPVLNVPTFIGNIGSQGQCQAGSLEGTYVLDVKNFNGSSFVDSGTTETITIVANQNELTAGRPGNAVMVIPKPSQSPTVMDIEAIGPCNQTAWSISIDCPVKIPRLLAGYDSSYDTICQVELDQYVYNVPVNSSSSQNNINIHDFIFADENGATPAVNGWYLHPTGYVYEVLSGIVISRINDICDVITVTDCKGGGNWTFNDRFGTNMVGEVIQYKRINAVTQEVPEVTYCGTITNIVKGTPTNAQQAGFINRACDDTTHCP
jgi:hypothetical protein|tara:strand:+ start:20588 stop:21769 length:1182 start_codon:yes stop_codon:yes gene_type:complete